MDDKSKIDKVLRTNGDALDTLSKSLRGYSTTIEEILEPTITNPVNFDKMTPTGGKNIHSNIFNIKGRNKSTKYNLGDYFYAMVDNPQVEVNELNGVLEGRRRNNALMNYMVNNMLELKNALIQLADDVVCPNVTTTSGINIEFLGANDDIDIEKYENLIKYFRPNENPLNTIQNRKKYSYNIDEDVKNIVFNFGVYGHHIVATIPYKKIVQDLLYEKDKENKKRNITSVSEAANIMNKSFYQTHKAYSESLSVDKLSEVFSDRVNNDIRTIVSTVPYSEADKDYVLKMIEEQEDSLFKDETTPKNVTIGEFLSPVESGVDALKQKQKRKFNIDNIVGCTHDVLDPSRTVPIYLKDDILGVYVIDYEYTDFDPNQVTLKHSMSNLIGATNLKDEIGLSSQYPQKLKEILFSDIRKVLNANLDKQLIKHNPNLIEDIEYILEQDNIIDNPGRPKIKFIPSEYLTIHKIDKGPLGVPLLLNARPYALAYIQLLQSELINKVFLEKPRWVVKGNYTGDTSSWAQTNKLINAFRKAIPRLSDVGVPDVMTTSSALYQTIVIPSNAEGRGIYEVEKIDGMNSNESNKELLQMLRNQATLAVGYPADLLDPSVQLDFAKKIANINMKTLKKIVDIQNNLSISMSEFCTKRLRYMLDNDNIDVRVTFDIPSELTSNINKELFDQKNQLSDIYQDLVDKDPRIRDEYKVQVMQYINKKILGEAIDLDLIDEALINVATYNDGTRKI